MSRVHSLASKKHSDLDELSEKLPRLPFNTEAEQGLLGSLLIDNRGVEKISHFLTPEHFYTVVHAEIYQAICTLVDRGENASPVTLKKYFQDHAHLEHVGGWQYLADLAANCISIVNTEDYALTLYKLHQRRALIDIAQDLSTAAQNYDFTHDDPAALIEEAEANLYRLAETGTYAPRFRTLHDFATEAVSQAEHAFKAGGSVTGVTTGLSTMDTKLGGLQPSDLVILAGRPSMGKTALAVNVAYNAAEAYARSGGGDGAIVGFFSLEMSGSQLAARVLAERSRVPSDIVRRGAAGSGDLKNFANAAHSLAQIPLYIDDSGALSISALRTRARRLKRQHGLSLLIVDYIQLLSGTGSKQGTDNRTAEVSEITRGLKALAKELNIPILALSQLSRAVEQREDKRPLLSDLRESGSIEQDADVVMFVYREEYYLSRTEPQINSDRHLQWQQDMADAHNKAEAIIAKQRHGRIGTCKLVFDPSFTRFSDGN
jgi:replicative DNA helicase